VSAAARRWWPLAAGILLGALVGVLVSLVGSSTQRAEAAVLVSSSAGTQAVRPMLPNLRELAAGGVVAGNVRSTLRLTESTEKVRSRLHAKVQPQSEVIVISATDPNADHARQLAQEAAVVFAQLVDARFGTGKPELHAAVLDSAHVQGGPDRHFLRNGLIGALVGLLVGAAAMFVRASSTPLVRAEGLDDPALGNREDVLAKRVEGVTARERALAEHSAKLAARERELDERDARLAAGERDLTARVSEVVVNQRKLVKREEELAAGERELQKLAILPPLPEPEEAVVVPEPLEEPLVAPRAGSWNLNQLQRAVDAESEASVEQVEEWHTYLYFLRGHAAADGSLPRQFDGLVEDVFSAVVDRAG
jgi:capsular polysaccharide biosynthesis protein